MFKVPLNTARSDTLPTSNINRGTALARMLRDAKAIIIDDAIAPFWKHSTAPFMTSWRNSYAPIRRFPSDSPSHSPRNTRRHRPRLHQIITHLAPYSTTRTSNQHQSPTYPSSGRRIRRLTDSYRK